MSLVKKLEDKLKRKEQEIQVLEIKIGETKAYIQALTDTIKLLPKDKKESVSVEDKLRPGSLVHKTWQFLMKSGKPIHINEILNAIGKTTNKKDKVALAGSLGWYVRRQEIFTRPSKKQSCGKLQCSFIIFYLSYKIEYCGYNNY